MSRRVQVVLDEEEAERFRSEAARESKSLSAWLRDAGRKALEANREDRSLSDPETLLAFFRDCDRREQGTEPGWEEHKRLALEGYRGGTDP